MKNDKEIYSIGKLINIKENNLYIIKTLMIKLLNENNIKWDYINKLSNDSLIIINEINNLKSNRLKLIELN